MAKGRIPYIQLAKKEILRFFENAKRRVYSETYLNKLLEESRDEWQLPHGMTVAKFIRFLQDNGNLQQLLIQSKKEPQKPIVRYGWGQLNPFDVALSLKSNSYLCYASAMFVHGLTDTLSRRLYINAEQSPKQPLQKTLSQEAINRAFASEQRESSLVYDYNDFEIQIVNGKHTGRLEVSLVNNDNVELPSTKIERTLIDLAVRPTYGGGVYEVLRAYQRAKDLISFPVLMATLKKLDYIYPYHQVIGFYMERAGYPKEQYEKLKQLGLQYDFYLAYGLRETGYAPEWRLYVPKGF